MFRATWVFCLSLLSLASNFWEQEAVDSRLGTCGASEDHGTIKYGARSGPRTYLLSPLRVQKAATGSHLRVITASG